MSEPVFWLSDGVFWLGGSSDSGWLETSGVQPQWIEQVHILGPRPDSPSHLPATQVLVWDGRQTDWLLLLHLLALSMAKKEFNLALLSEPGHSLLLANTVAVGRHNLLPRAALSVRLTAAPRNLDEAGLDELAVEINRLGYSPSDVAVLDAPDQPVFSTRFPAARRIDPRGGLLVRITAAVTRLERVQGRAGLVLQPAGGGSRVLLVERT